MDRVERLDRLRRRMLVGFLVAYVAWQLPTILRDALGASVTAATAAAATAVAALAGVVWIVYGVRLTLLGRRIAAEPEVARALQDERVRQWGRSAQVFGFWVLVVYLGGVRLGVLFWQPETAVVAQLGLVVAVVSVIGSFLYLDRD